MTRDADRPGPGLARMRLAWCATALLAMARRWAGFLVVGAAVLGIGYFVAAIGWPALPLLWAAASLPLAAALAVMLLHSLVATGLAWGLREALLPAHWIAAERALPLRARQRALADAAVVALAQAPLVALVLASLLSWRHADPAWLRGHWPRGLGLAAGSVALSLSGGVALLALRRRPVRQRPAARGGAATTAAPTPTRALILLPLWRGPARPVLAALVLGAGALLLCLAGAVFIWPDEPRWCLAAYAFAALAGCSRVHALARRTLGPLLAHAAPLPIDARWAPRMLRLLALLPALIAWPPLLAAMSGWPLAPLAAPAYAAMALLGPLAATAGTPGEAAEPRAARWLFVLVVWIALATELLR